MNIAITGATGFIGSHLLIRLLQKNYRVRILTRKSAHKHAGVEVFVGDLSDSGFDVVKFLDGIDVLFYCAGELHDADKMQAINVDAVARIAEYASKFSLHWIHLSSVGVYGSTPNQLVDEDTVENPQNEYERTKHSGDKIVQNIEKDSSMCWTIVRPANVYGNGMPSSRLLQMYKLVKNTGFFPLINKNAMAHFIHVDNVVDALLLCMKNNVSHYKVYINSETNKMSDVVEQLSVIAERSVRMIPIHLYIMRLIIYILMFFPFLKMKKSLIDVLIDETRYSSSKINKELMYEIRTPIDKGLKMFIGGAIEQ